MDLMNLDQKLLKISIFDGKLLLISDNLQLKMLFLTFFIRVLRLLRACTRDNDQGSGTNKDLGGYNNFAIIEGIVFSINILFSIETSLWVYL